MRKQPSVGEPARAAATIQPLDATTRQLAVLDAFAETGTYELTAAAGADSLRLGCLRIAGQR